MRVCVKGGDLTQFVSPSVGCSDDIATIGRKPDSAPMCRRCHPRNVAARDRGRGCGASRSDIKLRPTDIAPQEIDDNVIVSMNR